MTTISSQEEYDAMKSRYDEAMYKSSKWENELETKYNEDQQADIISMVSYWDNQFLGFGKRNDKQLYESIRKEDISGQLFEEAKIGFELSKLCIELGPPIIKWDINNKKNRRLNDRAKPRLALPLREGEPLGVIFR